jgi:hypothetical protein
MAFERFDGSVNMRANHPQVSISKLGAIRFNKPAMEALHIRDYKRAVFYYEESSQRIGIKLTVNDEAKGGYTLRFRKDGYCCDISASAFLRYIGYDYCKTRRFDVYKDDETGLLICDPGGDEYAK